MNFSSKRLVATAIVACLALAACGDDDDAASDTTSPAAEATEPPADATEPPTDATEPPTDATEPAAEATEPPATGDIELAAGEVFVTGSSTVEPISIRVGELRRSSCRVASLQVTVEGPGTGDGFAKFCAGETDISDASRPINDEEVADLRRRGHRVRRAGGRHRRPDGGHQPGQRRHRVPRRPGAVRAARTGVGGLHQLERRQRSGGRGRLGLRAVPRRVPLVVYGPGEESGTYDTFVEFAIADLAEERGADEATPRRLHVEPQRQPHRRGHRVGRHVARLGRLRLLRGGAGADEGDCRSTAATVASSRPPRRSATAATRSPAASTSTSTPPRRPRTRPSPRSSTSTCPTQGLATVGDAGYVDLPADRIQASQGRLGRHVTTES